jgi:hypothetical protein
MYRHGTGTYLLIFPVRRSGNRERMLDRTFVVSVCALIDLWLEGYSLTDSIEHEGETPVDDLFGIKPRGDLYVGHKQ